MKLRNLIRLILCVSAVAASGCGEEGGGTSGSAVPVATNEPTTLSLMSSKALALADGADAVTIRADVRRADNTTAPDGTVVAFSVPAGSGTLSTSSAVCTSGLAFVTLTRAPVTGANNQTITVTGTAGNVSGSTDVKFINQPTSVDVFIGINQNITNLAALNFKLINTNGASFDNAAQPVSAINTASGSLVVANFDAAANSSSIGMINSAASGCSTDASPIIKATFAVAAGGGLPVFSVDAAPGSFTALNPASGATTPAVSADNMIVTIRYDTEL